MSIYLIITLACLAAIIGAVIYNTCHPINTAGVCIVIIAAGVIAGIISLFLALDYSLSLYSIGRILPDTEAVVDTNQADIYFYRTGKNYPSEYQTSPVFHIEFSDAVTEPEITTTMLRVTVIIPESMHLTADEIRQTAGNTPDTKDTRTDPLYTIRCSNCGTENDSHNKYCTNCGYHLETDYQISYSDNTGAAAKQYSNSQ